MRDGPAEPGTSSRSGRTDDEAAVSTDESGHLDASPALLRRRAWEAVRAVLSDDNNSEQGIACARAVADTALAEAGAGGLREMVVVLSLKLAEALERISVEEGMTAADLADVWFVE
jgi:hypothetical protein